MLSYYPKRVELCIAQARIVTRAQLQSRYPDSALCRVYWETSEDEPDIGWKAEVEFKPTHLVEFHAYGAGQTPSLRDFVYLEPGVNGEHYREGFTPLDYEQGIDLGHGKMLFAPSYCKDPKTGKWWHARNLHPTWVRGRVRRVLPVTYMRELPSELRDPDIEWGSVYFVSAGVGGPIKIGWSTDVDRRIDELQTANPVKLTLVATVPGTMADEARLHELFAHLRIQSEWFRHDDEILNFIEEHRGGL